jgi:hypothetical protein
MNLENFESKDTICLAKVRRFLYTVYLISKINIIMVVVTFSTELVN